MYQFAIDGEFEIAGHVSADGALEKRESSEPNATLWAINSLSGQVESLSTLTQPAPYSPIIRYTFEEKTAAHVLQKTLFVTGTNLALPNYAKDLPPLFHKAQQ